MLSAVGQHQFVMEAIFERMAMKRTPLADQGNDDSRIQQ
jgi:hypothetical protein